MLVELIGVRALSILSDVMVSGMLLGVFYGVFRVSYVKTYGAWPHNRWTMAADFSVELFTNLVGAFNKLKVATGQAPILSSPQSDAKDAEIDRLRARVAELAAPQVAPAGDRAQVLRAVTLPDVGARVSRLPDAPVDVPPVVIPAPESE